MREQGRREERRKAGEKTEDRGEEKKRWRWRRKEDVARIYIHRVGGQEG